MLEVDVVCTPHARECRNGNEDEGTGLGPIEVLPEQCNVIGDVFEDIDEQERIGGSEIFGCNRMHEAKTALVLVPFVWVVRVDAHCAPIGEFAYEFTSKEAGARADINEGRYARTVVSDDPAEYLKLGAVVPVSTWVDETKFLEIHLDTPQARSGETLTVGFMSDPPTSRRTVPAKAGHEELPRYNEPRLS